jgi:hypothetical protein
MQPQKGREFFRYSGLRTWLRSFSLRAKTFSDCQAFPGIPCGICMLHGSISTMRRMPKREVWASCRFAFNPAASRSLGQTWNIRNKTRLAGSKTCAGLSFRGYTSRVATFIERESAKYFFCFADQIHCLRGHSESPFKTHYVPSMKNTHAS